MSTGSSRRTRKPRARRRSSSKEPTVPEVPETQWAPGPERGNQQLQNITRCAINNGILIVCVPAHLPAVVNAEVCVCVCVRAHLQFTGFEDTTVALPLMADL